MFCVNICICILFPIILSRFHKGALYSVTPFQLIATNHFWIISHKVKHWHQYYCLLKNQLDLRELSVKALCTFKSQSCICENSILPFVVFKKNIFQVLTAFLIVSCYCFLIKRFVKKCHPIANIWLRFDVPIYCSNMVFSSLLTIWVKLVGFISLFKPTKPRIIYVWNLEHPKAGGQRG